VAQEEMHERAAAVDQKAERKVDPGVDTKEKQGTWVRKVLVQTWVPLTG